MIQKFYSHVWAKVENLTHKFFIKGNNQDTLSPIFDSAVRGNTHISISSWYIFPSVKNDELLIFCSHFFQKRTHIFYKKYASNFYCAKKKGSQIEFGIWKKNPENKKTAKIFCRVFHFQSKKSSFSKSKLLKENDFCLYQISINMELLV